MSKVTFHPKILCFLCKWCGYSAADMAGTGRMLYPASVRAVEVLCSGMVHPNWVISALMGGMDGVMVVGCRKGQCHYGSGNELAQTRGEILEETMWELGLERERFRMEWLSAAEAERFVTVVTEMTSRLRQLGPNKPLSRIQLNESQLLYATDGHRFVHEVDGKHYYWDGQIYKDHNSAQKAISHYLDNKFEAKLIPDAKGILIYTRRPCHHQRGDD